MRISDAADLPMDVKLKKKLFQHAYEYLCPDELTKQANNEINEEMNVESSIEEQLPNSKQEDLKLLQNNYLQKGYLKLLIIATLSF